MTIKDPTPHRAWPALSGFGLLELQGSDAEAFAQAQFMNDVHALEPGQWQWNGWLNAKGRVIALFALLRREPGRLWLVLPDAPVTDLQASLQRYVFRSKLKIALVTDHRPAADFTPDANDDPGRDRLLAGPGQSTALDWGDQGGSRRLWLLPADHAALARPDAGTDARWREHDLAHGLPRLDAGQAEAWTPQMLSLERLSAFSVKKGCYPGQEIVARTHYLGQSKRALVRLAGQGLAAGQVLQSDGASVGTLVSATADGCQGLAVASVAATGSGFLVDGRTVQVLPLLPGLARPART